MIIMTICLCTSVLGKPLVHTSLLGLLILKAADLLVGVLMWEKLDQPREQTSNPPTLTRKRVGVVDWPSTARRRSPEDPSTSSKNPSMGWQVRVPVPMHGEPCIRGTQYVVFHYPHLATRIRIQPLQARNPDSNSFF